MHDEAALRRLEQKWLQPFWKPMFPLSPVPWRDIREYFGDQVAFYFLFLNHYQKFLIAPAVAGVVSYCLEVFEYIDGTDILLFYPPFLLLYFELFNKSWRRIEHEYLFRSGNDEVEKQAKFDSNRPDFQVSFHH